MRSQKAENQSADTGGMSDEKTFDRAMFVFGDADDGDRLSGIGQYGAGGDL